MTRSLPNLAVLVYVAVVAGVLAYAIYRILTDATVPLFGGG